MLDFWLFCLSVLTPNFVGSSKVVLETTEVVILGDKNSGLSYASGTVCVCDVRVLWQLPK